MILQALLSSTESQDVATIEVDRVADNSYQLQGRGDPVIYGVNYYVAPAPIIQVRLWPIVGWMYGPVYRPYRSVFYFGYYPRYYRPWTPVRIHVYRTRTVHYTTRRNFTVVRASRVTSVTKVGYRPSSSRLVKKGAVTKTHTSASGVQTDVTKVGKQGTNLETGRTKVTHPETGQSRVVKGASRTRVNSNTGTKTKVSAGKVKGSKGGKKTKVKKTKTEKAKKKPG